MHSYCQTAPQQWKRVSGFNVSGVEVSGDVLTFEQVWKQTHKLTDSQKISWDRLEAAVPSPLIPCLAFAVTYTAHRKEIGLSRSFLFEKNALPEPMSKPVPYRETLDYEAEIGVLVKQDDPKRFGFLLCNDLSDRGLQQRHFDAKNQAPGFTKAKSFEGGLPVGQILVISDSSIWEKLEIKLRVNGELRQAILAKNCLVTPEKIHQAAFKMKPTADWILVSSGTDEGSVFRPNVPLESLPFLKKGDVIEIESEILGYGKTVID